MFTFSEILALVESESSFGAYVCHRRPGGSTATSDLVVGIEFFVETTSVSVFSLVFFLALHTDFVKERMVMVMS